MYRTVSLLLTLTAVATAHAQPAATAGTPPAMSAARRDALVHSALAAAPAAVAAHATVLAPGADGKMIKLRDGTNGFTCLPDDDDHSGAMCADAEGMKWAESWMSHAAKPANTAPGVIYMLTGARDPSATDPFAKRVHGKEVVSGPHWMLMYPFSGRTSGLPVTPKRTGTWIMWDGTPYAHLMINQRP